MPDWLYHLTYIIIYRYAGAFVNENEFRNFLVGLPTSDGNRTLSCERMGEPGCAFLEGSHYLSLRYRAEDLGTAKDEGIFMQNFGICFLFYGGMIIVNLLAYILPLPAFVKRKFQE